MIVCFTSNESQRSAKSLETNRVPRYRAWSPTPWYSSSLCSWSMVGFLIRSRNSAWDSSRWSGILSRISDTLNSIWFFVPFWAKKINKEWVNDFTIKTKVAYSRLSLPGQLQHFVLTMPKNTNLYLYNLLVCNGNCILIWDTSMTLSNVPGTHFINEAINQLFSTKSTTPTQKVDNIKHYLWVDI